jgi:hypothetical protein
MSETPEAVAGRLVKTHGTEALAVARLAVGKMKMANKSLAAHWRLVERAVGVLLKP